ncbi:MAG: tripartite tricarboxylate transporter substrate binding protein [Betaproteobacteria bacterium]|nr:tripartite tricarboxylate transporter substrate binding protein [Betaproteobacteria bacterium]
MNIIVNGIAIALSAGLVAQAAAADQAASYPQRPVRIVIGFTPGGGPDITARFLGQKLSERWHQQIVTDNRPGAGGTIAANIVANANPDGHTLLSVSNAHSVAAAIFAKLPYDTVKDFAGITMTASGPALLLVSPALNAKSAKDLIAMAKAKPGQFNFSSAGIGSGAHFAAELFKNMAGIDVVHVPFKGIPEAITETMTGRVQFFLSPLASALNLVKDGRAQAVGVSGAKRATQFPDIPTIAESGLPGYRYEYWYGMLAPAKTPRAIVEKLNREITDIMRAEDVRNRWIALGVEPAPMTPQAFDQWIRDDIAASIKLARAANIKAD